MSVVPPPAVAPQAVHRLTVNGTPVEVVAPGGRRLLDVLRLDLGLTGAKEGCGEGECGACSVLLDGMLVASCLVPVCQAAGHDVVTVEGLGGGAARATRPAQAVLPPGGPATPALGPLQQAFLEGGAVQCGMCTPGMLLAAQAFLATGEPPTESAVREAIAGNLCRCTGYTKIVEAIQAAAGHGLAAPAASTGPAGGGARGVSPAPAASLDAAALAPDLSIRLLANDGPVIAPIGAPTVLGPGSLDEALRLVAEGFRPLAGGTDLYVGLAAGTLPTTPPLVDLDGLDELRGIRRDAGCLVVEALATFAELQRSPEVRAVLPVLAEAASSVGSPQIRNRGTVGGNIVNASPAGDLLPVLLATDADLVLRSLRGERAVPAAAFFTGYRQTARAADELLVAVRFPIVPGRRVRFRKVGARRALAISKVVMAVAWRPDRVTGVWSDVRVAYGSVAEVPIRAPRAEAALEGSVPSVEVADAAAVAAESDVRPIDDIRSTAEYRRAVSGRILRRMVLDAIEDQGPAQPRRGPRPPEDRPAARRPR